MKQGLKQCQQLRIILFFHVAWTISNPAQLDYDRLYGLGWMAVHFTVLLEFQCILLVIGTSFWSFDVLLFKWLGNLVGIFHIEILHIARHPFNSEKFLLNSVIVATLRNVHLVLCLQLNKLFEGFILLVQTVDLLSHVLDASHSSICIDLCFLDFCCFVSQIR